MCGSSRCSGPASASSAKKKSAPCAPRGCATNLYVARSAAATAWIAACNRKCYWPRIPSPIWKAAALRFASILTCSDYRLSSTIRESKPPATACLPISCAPCGSKIAESLPSSGSSPPVVRRISWERNSRIALFVANRCLSHGVQRNNSRPNGKSIIGSVIFGRTEAHFCGSFREWQAQDARGLQFFFIGLARVVPAMRQNLFCEGTQRFEFFLQRIDERGFAERHDGAVIHGVIEHRPCKHDAVCQRDCHADFRALADAAEHSAGGGAVKINGVADTRVQRGNHEWLAIRGKADMAHKPFIENLVNGFAVVGAALGFAHNTRALSRREGVGHCAPHGETWRGAGPFVAAHLICSRRQSGMSEEQPRKC